MLIAIYGLAKYLYIDIYIYIITQKKIVLEINPKKDVKHLQTPHKLQ